MVEAIGVALAVAVFTEFRSCAATMATITTIRIVVQIKSFIICPALLVHEHFSHISIFGLADHVDDDDDATMATMGNSVGIFFLYNFTQLQLQLQTLRSRALAAGRQPLL